MLQTARAVHPVRVPLQLGRVPQVYGTSEFAMRVNARRGPQGISGIFARATTRQWRAWRTPEGLTDFMALAAGSPQQVAPIRFLTSPAKAEQACRPYATSSPMEHPPAVADPATRRLFTRNDILPWPPPHGPLPVRLSPSRRDRWPRPPRPRGSDNPRRRLRMPEQRTGRTRSRN